MQPDPRIAAARSMLFVPADRTERIGKAIGSGADIVVVDLEDAVAPAAKYAARTALAAWLGRGASIVVRVNSADTEWFRDDLALCRSPSIMGVMLPKAMPDDALREVARLKPTIALIENATGVSDMDAIASTGGVCRLALGAIDLALDLGITADDVVFDPLRLQMVIASRAAGIAPPVDGVTTDFRNETLVCRDAKRARALGFGGKLAIHPCQIAPIAAAFKPSVEEIEEAHRIVSAASAAQGGAVSLDSKMIDKPVVERAIRILAESGALT